MSNIKIPSQEKKSFISTIVLCYHEGQMEIQTNVAMGDWFQTNTKDAAKEDKTI